MGVKHRDPKQVVKRIDERLAEINGRQARVLSEIETARLAGTEPAPESAGRLAALNDEAEALRSRRKQVE
jgi:hypothetical protein